MDTTDREPLLFSHSKVAAQSQAVAGKGHGELRHPQTIPLLLVRDGRSPVCIVRGGCPVSGRQPAVSRTTDLARLGPHVIPITASVLRPKVEGDSKKKKNPHLKIRYLEKSE